MKIRSETFSLWVGVAFFLWALYLLYRLVAFLIATLYTLSPSVSGPILAAVFAIIGSVLVSVIGKYLEKRLAVEAAFRERRLKTYETFLTTFQTIMDRSSNDLAITLKKINIELILWGGPKLLKTYTKFFRQAAIDSQSSKTFFLLEEFYKAIRSDLGHSNRGLVKGDILSLIVKLNELEDFLKKAEENPEYRIGSTV